MLFKTVYPLFLVLFVLACKPQAQHGDHNISNAHMNKRSFEELVANFESPDRETWQKPDEVLELLGPLEGRTFMDIGAGTGYFAFRLTQKGAKVISADVDQRFIDYVEEKKKQLGDSLISTRKIPYDSPSLAKAEVTDVIIVDTYHHIEDRVTYFKAVKEGIQAGGRLIVIDFKKEETPHGPPVHHRFSPEEVKAELEQSGFSDFTVDTQLLPYQYILIAKGN